MNDNNTFNNFGYCLSCSKSLEVIRDFFTVMEDGLENSPEEYRSLFSFIGKPMSVAQDDMKYLKQLFLNPNKTDRLQLVKESVNEYCVSNLQEVIYRLYELYTCETNYEEDIFTRSCSQILQHIAIKFGQNDKLKEWKEIIIEADKYEAKDEIKPDLDKKAKKACSAIKKLIENFVYAEHEFEVEGDCFTLPFRNYYQEKYGLREKYVKLSDRIYNLEKPYQEIVLRFIQKTPKRFGEILSTVMEIKEISEQDIVKIYTGEKKLTVSNIQALKKCKTPAQDTVENGIVSAIARILFVEENLLLYGYGKSYGNWKDFIDNFENSKKEDNKERKQILENNKRIVFETVREISSTEDSFKEYLKNPISVEELPQISSVVNQLLLCTDQSPIEDLIKIIEEIKNENRS